MVANRKYGTLTTSQLKQKFEGRNLPVIL